MADSERRWARYERWAERVEIPMLVLSVLLIPVVMMPVMEDLSPEAERALEQLGVVIWLAFVAEYVTLLALSPDRWHTVRTRKIELLLVVLPLLRPLRLVRVVRLAKAGTAFVRATQAFRRLMGRPGFVSTLATVTALILASGGLVAIAEHDQPDSTITGLGDGLWWALVTCATVGYGDEFPVTATGRFIAVVLMLAGISGLSVVTANVAAYFVADDEDIPELAHQLDRIERQLEHLTRQLGASGPTDTPDETAETGR